jgi:SAM-dependent methyltransferase
MTHALERNFRMLKIETSAPIAYDSPDHLQPWGTARDSSTNIRFNRKLYPIFHFLKRPLRILDIGCSGGGFVRSCLNDGCIAVGVEGSDYSKRMLRAEWAYLADRFLFTADITKPFTIKSLYDDGVTSSLIFDVITSWDVLEHITIEDLPEVIKNIKNHLAPSGLCVFSISMDEEIIDGVRLHQTVETRDWWINLFSQHGLHHLEGFEEWFGGQYVRGKKYGAPGSFHLVLSPDPANAPASFGRTRVMKLYDWWYGSRPYWFVQKLLEKA